MNRYNFEIQYNPRCSNYEVETIEHEEGDFVFYEDYKAQLAAAEKHNAALIGVLASDIYEAMLNLKGKFIHHENEFLPADVACDFVGKAKFLVLLEQVIAKHIRG